VSEPGGFKRRFRATTEKYLTAAAMDAMRARYPEAGAKAPAFSSSFFWSRVFVPVYSRIPWGAKRKMMALSGMTAKGWTPPSREPGTPWEPPKPR